MKPAVIIDDLYNVLQTLIFVFLCVTLVWDALFWVSGYSHLWMNSGFNMPLAALATNVFLCALYIAATFVAQLARRLRRSAPQCRAETADLAPTRRPLRADPRGRREDLPSLRNAAAGAGPGVR